MKVVDKAVYQRRIWTYKKRRKIFKNRISELTKKISQWNNEVRRIERTQDKLKKISKSVNDYFNVDISSKKMDDKHKLARAVYYKISIESKIQGKLVSEYIGRFKKTAGAGRLSFTRSFKTIPKNREAYFNFKKYFDTNSND
jgi:predicted  nucleic acid-binding Zn-ribbon protein